MYSLGCRSVRRTSEQIDLDGRESDRLMGIFLRNLYGTRDYIHHR